MAGSDPKGDRNLVRLEPNERVDLPDLKALQDNGRSETRMLMHNFLFGHGEMGVPNNPMTPTGWLAVRSVPTSSLSPITASGLPDSQTNHSKAGLCNLVEVTTPTATTVTLNVKFFPELDFGTGAPLEGGPQTGGFGGVELDDGGIELGSAVGTEGDDSQTLDMSGKLAGDYAVYFGSTYDAGSPQARLFWNNNTMAEATQSMDTRKIAGWNMRCELLAGGPPDDGYQLVYVFHWDGATISNDQYWQNNIFEGIAGSETPFHYSSGWGEDGSVGAMPYGMRSNNRVYGGVSCWQDWASAIRSQLRDIIGDGEASGRYGWWTQSPEFDGTGGSSLWTGERSSLTHARDHVQTDTDPHGPDLTQTNLTIANSLTSGLGHFTAGVSGASLDEITMTADSFTIHSDEDIGSTYGVVCTSPLHMKGSGAYIIAENGIRTVRSMNSAPFDTAADAKKVYMNIGAESFIPCNEGFMGSGTWGFSSLMAGVDVGYEFGFHAAGGGMTAYQWVDPSQEYARVHFGLQKAMGWGGQASGSSPLSQGGVRILKIYWHLWSNPAWAGGTLADAAKIYIKKRNMGLSTGNHWTTIKYENLSQGNNGTTAGTDLMVPPDIGGVEQVPTVIIWDMTGDPDADWTMTEWSGEVWDLQVRLQGDNGTAFSPYFAGCTIELAVLAIL